MKKFIESLDDEVKAVALILLAALVFGLLGTATMWCVHHNETLPQERRQFLDL